MIPKITLWSLLGLGIVFIALFFLGGSNGSLEVAGDFLDIPRFTLPCTYYTAARCRYIGNINHTDETEQVRLFFKQLKTDNHKYQSN